MIYEHRTSLLTSAGSTSTFSLRIISGLMQQLFIKAATDTTVFRVNLTDTKGIVRMNYGFERGELNDVGRLFPMVGMYTINITNASPNDTFDVVMAVQETTK